MKSYSCEDNVILFKLSPDIYCLEDFFLAQNLMSDKCSLDIKTGTHIEIKLITNEKRDLESLAQEFLFYLSEQKVRNILDKKNRKIKELIVEQAFKPIANLKERLNEC